MTAPHCMIDLETLGTLPGSIILSIGAVIFDPTKSADECLGKEFYCVINRADSEAHGLAFSQDTLNWWMKQSPAARRVLADVESLELSDMLPDSLRMLADFIPSGSKVWSNGANFDQPLLDVAYDRCGIALPWKFWNSRCHRTILGLHANPKSMAPKNTLAHNALEDAKTQARQIVAVAHALGIKLN